MNLVYFGSGAFGLPTLQRLAAHHAVRAVVTQPDRPAGRGGKLTPTPIAQWCHDHAPQLTLIKPEKVNDPAVIDQVRSLHADAWVVIAFGQKLSRKLLDGVFAINLHASLLPRWRGAAPINAAMLAGDSLTGNSVITLADRMDAGLVLGQTTRSLTDDLTAGELHDLLAADGPDLVEEVLRRHQTGTLSAMHQDESMVTQAAKLSRADSWVDFHRPARECLRRIHGLTPWPGIGVVCSSSSDRLPMAEFKVLRVEPAGAPPEQPRVSCGQLLTAPDQGLIACGGDTWLRVVELQPPGKRPMTWEQFARGHRLTPILDIRSSVPPPSEPVGGRSC
ncbi:MAG: Methionyl-tRNA formyltransferase [Phycisphaerales bacterium]|nr:Methionyl-tRNA formyltransferase [Phycisphaerales bacterium]